VRDKLAYAGGEEATLLTNLNWQAINQKLMQGRTITPSKKPAGEPGSYQWCNQILEASGLKINAQIKPVSHLGAWVLDIMYTEFSCRGLTNKPCQTGTQFTAVGNATYKAMAGTATLCWEG
jgi:hypothetical protein